MLNTNVFYLNNLAQAKIQALKEKLNEATRCFQLTQEEFQARIQEQEAQNKQLLEELKAVKPTKSVEEVDNPNPKHKGKDAVAH